jgi:FlaG/FlaF family flagellin (archaellin)
MTGLRSDERGVSELIGYVLAFSIVVASVGAVYAGGLGAAMEFQQDERETNAERAFVALA